METRSGRALLAAGGVSAHCREMKRDMSSALARTSGRMLTTAAETKSTTTAAAITSQIRVEPKAESVRRPWAQQYKVDRRQRTRVNNDSHRSRAVPLLIDTTTAPRHHPPPPLRLPHQHRPPVIDTMHLTTYALAYFFFAKRGWPIWLGAPRSLTPTTRSSLPRSCWLGCARPDSRSATWG